MLKQLFLNNTADKIRLNPFVLLFAVFITVHILLFNVNFAEWGDSYRILRASEFIRNLSYPEDEKRQPLFSLVLAFRPYGVDQIFWGRLEMLVVSIASFVLFKKILELFKMSEKEQILALVLFIFNPVFLYWSLRIYADVFFTLIALLTFYLYIKWKPDLTVKRLFIIGVLLALSVLTRFEGFLLSISIGVSLVYGVLRANILKAKAGSDLKSNLSVKNVVSLVLSGETIRVLLRRVLALGAGFITIMAFWLIYRNPFESKYFEEPASRVYDINTLLIYLSSLFYLSGFTAAAFFIIKNLKASGKFFADNIELGVFVVLELFLALVWPAAIPRLFTPAIPFLIIILAKSVIKYFDENKKPGLKDILLLIFLLGFYVLTLYKYKLQFLVLIKPLFFATGIAQVFLIPAILLKRYRFFLSFLFVSLTIWSVSTVYLHKDIYRAVVMANKYSVENLQGRVAYNDVSSVSDWYLNQKSQNDNVEGFYLNMDSKKGRTYENLLKNKVDYIMITNEHNATLKYDAKETPYLEEIKEFRYTIRGTNFFTKILKLKK